MSLHVTTSGAGPDLVLVHGWGMNNGVWEPLLPVLAERYRVSMVELPGHGASPPPAGGSDLRDWAGACVESVPAGATWLGWSLGGQVALSAAREHPEHVADLFLVGSTPRFVQSDDWPAAMPAVVFQEFADSLLAAPDRTLQRFLGLQVRGAGHARETLRALRRAVDARPAAGLEGLRQGLQLLLRDDLRSILAGLEQRISWLFGGRDTLVPPAAADAVTKLLPGAPVHLVEGAGHAPFLSHPDACLSLLQAHVEACRAA